MDSIYFSGCEPSARSSACNGPERVANGEQTDERDAAENAFRETENFKLQTKREAARNPKRKRSTFIRMFFLLENKEDYFQELTKNRRPQSATSLSGR